jgi:hypothetical protein
MQKDAVPAVSSTLSGENQKILMSLETQVAVLNSKFDYMAKDIKTLAEGSSVRLASLETRVNSLEKVNDEIKPVALAAIVTTHDQQLRDLKVMYKTIVWAVGGLCTSLGIVVTLVSRFFGFMK